MTEEQDLERKAVEELLREAARARVRAETMGPAGWAKCPLHSTNKRFLLNTLRKTTLRPCSDRSGSSQTETRRRRDGRQNTEPRFRRTQRVRPSEDTHSPSPTETQPTSKTLSPKNTHTQTQHNDRRTQTNQNDTHAPTHRLTNHNDQSTCTDRSTKMTNTYRPARVTNQHGYNSTEQAPSSNKSHK